VLPVGDDTVTTIAFAVAAAILIACAAAAYLLAIRGRPRAAWALGALAPLAAVLPLAGLLRVAESPAPATEPAVSAPTAAPRAPPPVATPPASAAPSSPVPAAERAAADDLRKAKRFAEARDAYAALAARHPGDPDLWADLADSGAAANGGDLEPSAEAIDQALRLAPDHVKALWLKASLELQRHHYAAAGQIWQKLLALVPPDSEDHRIVAANLSEAQALAAKGQSPN
jgi:cytochrome c-type biogenesis protein CcmH